MFLPPSHSTVAFGSKSRKSVQTKTRSTETPTAPRVTVTRCSNVFYWQNVVPIIRRKSFSFLSFFISWSCERIRQGSSCNSRFHWSSVWAHYNFGVHSGRPRCPLFFSHVEHGCCVGPRVPQGRQRSTRRRVRSTCRCQRMRSRHSRVVPPADRQGSARRTQIMAIDRRHGELSFGWCQNFLFFWMLDVELLRCIFRIVIGLVGLELAICVDIALLTTLRPNPPSPYLPVSMDVRSAFWAIRPARVHSANSNHGRRSTPWWAFVDWRQTLCSCWCLSAEFLSNIDRKFIFRCVKWAIVYRWSRNWSYVNFNCRADLGPLSLRACQGALSQVDESMWRLVFWCDTTVFLVFCALYDDVSLIWEKKGKNDCLGLRASYVHVRFSKTVIWWNIQCVCSPVLPSTQGFITVAKGTDLNKRRNVGELEKGTIEIHVYCWRFFVSEIVA